VLLARTPSWHPEVRYIVAVATVLTVAALLIPHRRLGRAGTMVIVTGVLAGVLGSGAFAAATAASPHTGSIPAVGPAQAQTSSMGGGGMGGGGAGGGQAPSGSSSGTRPSGAPNGSGGPGRASSGGSSSTSSTPPGNSTSGAPASGSAATGSGSATGAPSGGGGDAATTSSALTAALKATTTTWAAATVGDQSAAQLELDSGKAVIAIGGWSGTDASPTLAQFKADVAAGKITYFILSSSGGPGGGSNGVASQITAWVKANFTSRTIGSTTVYVLTGQS
jgi:hypothetical protein